MKATTLLSCAIERLAAALDDDSNGEPLDVSVEANDEADE